MLHSVKTNLPAPKTILIADDHGLIRDGLRALLDIEERLQVVGVVATGRDAIRAARELTPDLVLMEFSLLASTGAFTITEIKRWLPHTRILVLTFHRDEAHLFAALDAGAEGYLLKGDSRHELADAIRSLLAGEKYLSPAICDLVIAGYLGQRNLPLPDKQTGDSGILSPRELEVLRMIANGLRTREIAKALGLSPKTVERHRGSLMRKIKVRNAAAAAAYALANGLAQP